VLRALCAPGFTRFQLRICISLSLHFLPPVSASFSRIHPSHVFCFLASTLPVPCIADLHEGQHGKLKGYGTVLGDLLDFDQNITFVLPSVGVVPTKCQRTGWILRRKPYHAEKQNKVLVVCSIDKR
jgi:hypothetical protein